MNLQYLHLHNAHTGDTLKITKPIRYHSLADFKQFISQSWNVTSPFLLTTYGLKLNFAIINELTQVFVFDKSKFDVSPNNSQNTSPLHKTPSPPNFEKAESGIKKVAGYFTDVGNPSESVTSPSANLVPNTDNAARGNSGPNFSEKSDKISAREFSTSNDFTTKSSSVLNISRILDINIIFSSLTIIFQFAVNFINDIKKRYKKIKQFLNFIIKRQLHTIYKDHLLKLRNFPKVFNISLYSLLDENKLIQNADYIQNNLPIVSDFITSLDSKIDLIDKELYSIDSSIKAIRSESIKIHASEIEGNEITEDGVIKKDTVIQSTFKGKLAIISAQIFKKIAQLQWKVVELKLELNSITDEKKNIDHENGLNRLSNSSSDDINSPSSVSFQTINQINSYQDYLSLTIDLPLLFGLLIIEKRRQFEWYDFYSKGVVSNVTEQLISIIDQEQLFRSLWMKKFGNFLNLIDSSINTKLPTLDVTLVGNKENNDFGILNDQVIERTDLVNYIEVVSKSSVSSKFVEILNKNYKDLISSTNNMKNITKIISALSTYTAITDDKLKIIEHNGEDSQNIDFDVRLMNGLKSRVKKLENLLHQQQYKNLSNWPVTTTNEKASMIIERTPSFNSKQLLPKIEKSIEKSAVLDTSGLDKHLDNIRLRKEIAEIRNQNKILAEENNRVKNENQDLVEENADLVNKVQSLSKTVSENEKLNTSNEKQIFDLEGKIQILINQLAVKESNSATKFDSREEEYRVLKLDAKINAKEIETLTRRIEQKDQTIDEIQQKFMELKANNPLESSNEKLRNTVTKFEKELIDAKSAMNDVYLNMSTKEAQHVVERKSLESIIKDLESKVDILQSQFDELSEDYENLMELTHSKEKHNDLLIYDLNNIIITLLSNVRRSVEQNYESFLEFCLMIESMGLLLVKENGEYKITRVKGLRVKKDEDASESKPLEKPSSEVISEIEAKKSWTNEISNYNSILPNDSTDSSENLESKDSICKQQSLQLITLFNTIFNSENSKFDDFLRTIGFKDKIHLQDDSLTTRFFLNAVSKRFRDVEGFAKRQTKDNKSKQVELNKLLLKLDSKISINSFQLNDLVLFLPTRVERSIDDEKEESQPWAAFNIGAPHYFLQLSDKDNFKNRDWMVGKLTEIEKYKVTEENLNDMDSNPFQLSVGVVWYMVSAKDVHI